MSSCTEQEWVLGPQGTPFYVRKWIPASEPTAHILFIHGFLEHIDRYLSFFSLLASAPHNIHITAYDQRGFGRTSRAAQAHSVPDEMIAQRKKEGKAVKSARGNKKTSWAEQMEDAEFFVKRVVEVERPRKVFLMGQSMGGGLTLAFATRTFGHPSKETVAQLSGCIALSPLIKQSKPEAAWKLWLGSRVAPFVGGATLPTPLDPRQFSHDPAAVEAVRNDPLCAEHVGSVKGVSDMLMGGKALADRDWKNWPKELPLLILHGGDDPVTSPTASEEFVKNVKTVAQDATVNIIPGLFHEIHNETAPAPTEQAQRIASWVHGHVGGRDASGPAEDRSMTTMRTEGGERIIGSEVDSAANKLAREDGENGYAGEAVLHDGLEEDGTRTAGAVEGSDRARL